MKQWRPKNWAPCTIDNLTNYQGITHKECYEAGADAMLEALIVKGCRFTRKPLEIETYKDGSPGLLWIPAGEVHQKGYLVFIPDEK